MDSVMRTHMTSVIGMESCGLSWGEGRLKIPFQSNERFLVHFCVDVKHKIDGKTKEKTNYVEIFFAPSLFFHSNC